MNRLILISFFILTSLAAHAQTQGGMLAVAKIKVQNGVDPLLGKVAEDYFVSEISRGGVYQVIGRDAISRLLDQEQAKQMTTCTDDSCLSSVARGLGVDYWMAGSMDMVDNSVVLSTRLLHVRTASVAVKDSERLEGITEADALNGVAALVKRMFRPQSNAKEIGMWVSAGISVALGATGAVLLGRGFHDLERAQDLTDQSRTKNISYQRVINLEDSGHTQQIAGGMLIGMSVLSATSSIALYFLRDESPNVSISAFPLENGVGVMGRF